MMGHVLLASYFCNRSFTSRMYSSNLDFGYIFAKL